MPEPILANAADRIRNFYTGLSTPARTALIGGVLGGGAGLAAQRMTRGAPDEKGQRRSIVSPLTAALLGAAGGAGMSSGYHMMTTPNSTASVFGQERVNLPSKLPMSATAGGVAGGALSVRNLARRFPGTAALRDLQAQLKDGAPAKGAPAQDVSQHAGLNKAVSTALDDVRAMAAKARRSGVSTMLDGAGDAIVGAGKAVGSGAAAAGAALRGQRGAQNPHVQKLLVALGKAGKGVSNIGAGAAQVGRSLTDPLVGGTKPIRDRVMAAVTALESGDRARFHPGNLTIGDVRGNHAVGGTVSPRALAGHGLAGAGAGAIGGYALEQIIRKALGNVL